MADFTQTGYQITLSTPLGKDKLLVRSMSGEESLSRPFHFILELFSEDAALDFKALIGRAATVALVRPDGKKRYVNGIVSRFVQRHRDQRVTTYHAELVPWPWLLTLDRDCRIFQEQSVPDIIKAVFQDGGHSDYRFSLKSSYAKREYCVQYLESGFDFVSRLMEEEGLFYFFEHKDGSHVMVIADDASAHKPCPDLGAVRYRPNVTSRFDDDELIDCMYEQAVTSDDWAGDDYAFVTPDTQLYVKAGGPGKRRVYDWPGGWEKKDQGERTARLRLQALEHPGERLSGEGAVMAMTPGYTFTLSDHDRKSVNGGYVVRRVLHEARLDGYRNRFEAFPEKTVFRPPLDTPRPFISGAQTALVVGKAGEEIWTDKWGRIKVQFHWDQRGKADENASCWVRVAQTWAGKSWGTWFLPRIGQEVVVSFLDGDPDRPLVTGVVYNGRQTLPYALPAEQTKSTIKTNSSKGGGGYNELRFEDKKGSEEIYLQGEKDMNVLIKNQRETTIDKSHDILTLNTGNRLTTIKKGDDTLKVDTGKRTVLVKSDESTTVKAKRTIKVTGNENHTNSANFVHKVQGNYTLKVTGNITIQAGGQINVKAGRNIQSKAGMNIQNKAGMNMANKAGMNIQNKGGMQIQNKAGMKMASKAGMMMENKAGMMAKNKAGMMAKTQAGMMSKTQGGMMAKVQGGLMAKTMGGVMAALKGLITKLG